MRNWLREMAEYDAASEDEKSVMPTPRAQVLANMVRKFLQLALAIAIIVTVAADIFLFNQPNEGHGFRILGDVGKILAFSAAIDLAYMLITPGPDEAFGPLIIGIASAVLILVSSLKVDEPNDTLLIPCLSAFLLVIAIGLLFYVQQKYLSA